MQLSTSIVMHTANVLGIFTDPFEFAGNYGPEINPTRQKVFEVVISQDAFPYGSVRDESQYGPTFAELIPSELLNEIAIKIANLDCTSEDFNKIQAFIQKYKDKKVFRFLRNNPSVLLNLDHTLRIQAANTGKLFDLPILGSTQPLVNSNKEELKRKLHEALFNNETLHLTKPKERLKSGLQALKPEFLSNYLGEVATNTDLEAFTSPLGQIFFYWMYHSLNLHLISEQPGLIDQVNKTKELFARTLGNPEVRAQQFKEKLLTAKTAVLFTQECDRITERSLTEQGLFLPVDRQNKKDGTLVFLRSDVWEPDYKVLPMDNYERFESGSINLILARQIGSGRYFLLGAAHGHSTNAEDGRTQISLIMQKFHQLGLRDLQVVIGTDANTKSELDVVLFKEHADRLGLVCTQAGPTTVKQRMVTAQHTKAGRFAIDQEDYLLILKPESGGQFEFTQVTVGFKAGFADLQQPLPNADNPSDHYPVGASLKEYRF